MKILYVCTQPDLSQYAQSGPGTHIREMIAAFRTLGHDVDTFICGDDLYRAAGQAKNSTSSIKNLVKRLVPGIVWRSLKDKKLLKHNSTVQTELLDKINTYKPDLIYERGSYLQYTTAQLASTQNIKLALEINAPFADQRKKVFGNSWLYSKAKQIEKTTVQYADKLFVVSSVLKTYYASFTDLPGKIQVLPNAVNKRKVLATNSGDQIRSKLGIGNEIVIGFVGSIFKYHGVHLLLKAFMEVEKFCPRARLVIVGDGEVLPELKNLAIQNRIAEKVIFTGSVPPEEVYAYIKAMDVTVLPDTGDYMSPIKIFEYGALGKPIIAPDKAAVKDVMVNMQDGVLVEPNSSEIAQQLLFLINNPDAAEKMAKNFQEKVLKEHTWENNAKKVLESISSIS